MRTRSLAATLLVALAPYAVSTSAFAQTTDDPIVKAARARFNEGVDFYDKGQYENARTSFLQAYALRKHPAVLVNLAQSALRSGHTLEAAKYFQLYLHESASLSAAQRTDAEKGLAEARTKLGRIEVSAPAGTDIEIDGESVGTTPLSEPVDVEPGSHTVKSSSDSKTLTVAAGQVEQAKLNAAAPAVMSPSRPPPNDEAAPSHDEPSPTEAKPASVAETSSPGLFSRPRTMAPFWIGLGVGIAGGATTIVFAIFKAQADSNAQSVETQITNAAHGSGTSTTGLCTNPPTPNFAQACQTLQNDNNLVDTNATVANIGLGVGIAGVAFSLGWNLFAAKRDATEGAATNASGAFVPFVGPHSNGLGYEGSF